MLRLFGIDTMRKAFAFKCGKCNRLHRGAPSFGFQKPPYVFDVPEHEREARVELSDDLCQILPSEPAGGDTIYAIRATLDIPIIGSKTAFCWGVWVSQSEASFKRYQATMDSDRSGNGSFGWLPVVMPYYKRTGNGQSLEHLACDVEWGAKDQRPKVTVKCCDHPLHRHQSEGLDWDTAVEIARLAMHGPDGDE